MSEMRRESPYPMVSIDEATRLIMAQVAPLGDEEVDALVADGRMLSAAIHALEDLPDLPKAAMDGYALRAADGIAERQVIAELTAGHEPGLLIGPGQAARIMTGAPMPNGADAMIPVELTEEQNGLLRVSRALQPGDYVHSVGQDVARGASTGGPAWPCSPRATRSSSPARSGPPAPCATRTATP
jgi:molybdopterin molybdotransferase